jgi:ABC-type transport system involved in multi-copper enzyme maturation permease subunit
MRPIWILARNSFREKIRERVFLVIAGLAVFLVLLSLLLGELSFDEQARMLGDFGLAATELSAVAVALFSGAFLLAREIERQTCLLILSKPISRSQFIIGQWAGSAFLLVLLIGALVFTLSVLMWTSPLIFFAPAFSIFAKCLILLSWALFASTFVRPILALLSAIALYLLGHWLGDLEFFARKAGDGTLVALTENLRWIVPNFDLFNWKSFYYLEQPPAFRDIMGLFFHMIAWVGLLLTGAGYLFGRKDIV